MLKIPEQYINMCKQSEEIQSLWKPQDGDWFATNQKDPNIFVISGYHNLCESLGGTMWFFNGHLCNRDGGIFANQTACDCINKKGYKPDKLQQYCVASLDEMIWLPRQDQLQNLLIDKLDSFHDFRYISFLFYSWLSNDYWQSYQSKLNSFEELWLAFLMYNQYNKIWDNQEWRDSYYY